MPSFQITVSPTRRAAARFIAAVRRSIQEALVEEYQARGLTQSEIARVLKVHRSVINREIRGERDLSLGRVGELAFVLGRKPQLLLERKKQARHSNLARDNAAESASSAGNIHLGNVAVDGREAVPPPSNVVRIRIPEMAAA